MFNDSVSRMVRSGAAVLAVVLAAATVAVVATVSAITEEAKVILIPALFRLLLLNAPNGNSSVISPEGRAEN